MGYAVVGYFDKATNEWIRRIWKELMVNDIDDYLYNSENNPHIKFAMYDNLKEIDIINAIEDISQTREQIDIIFKSYSFYPNDQPFFNIDMATSMPLLELQAEIRRTCDRSSTLLPIDFFDESYSFYPNDQPFFNIDMATSMPLLELQAEIRRTCDRSSTLLPIDFFDEGTWKPDCQLTREVDKKYLSNTAKCLYEKKLPIKGKLESIGLIKFHPAKQIIHFNLS